jgi:transposase
MMLIGIDPHKSTRTATAIAPDANHEVASIRIDATLGEYRRLLTWARQWPQRRWAVENAEGLGRHLTSWLLARGEDVVDVSTTATARVRQLSRGGGRKNDRIDAGAAACVAALQGDARPLEAEGYPDAMAVLDERRVNLAQSRVRAVNQLHALLRALIAGGAPRDLSATTAAARLRSIRPHGAVEQARKAVAKDLLSEIRTLDRQLKANAKAIAGLVAAAESTLTEVVGVGPIMAGRLISRTGRASRFPTASAFANYAGAAPVEIASAEKSRHRLSRHGDRQLNSAPSHHCDHPDPHLGQPRQPLLPNQDRRGKDTTRGRALPEETPRRPPLARHDHRRTTAGGEPGRTSGGGSAIQRGWLNPNNQLFGQVTSQTRQPRLYDDQASRLTNTEAPKGSNLPSHSEAHVNHVMRELNERPRKGLGYDTPAARFAKETAPTPTR